MCSLREEQESLGALADCKSDRLEALLAGPSPTHLPAGGCFRGTKRVLMKLVLVKLVLVKLVLVKLVPINLVLMKLLLVELVLVKNNLSWWNWS